MKICGQRSSRTVLIRTVSASSSNGNGARGGGGSGTRLFVVVHVDDDGGNIGWQMLVEQNRKGARKSGRDGGRSQSWSATSASASNSSGVWRSFDSAHMHGRAGSYLRNTTTKRSHAKHVHGPEVCKDDRRLRRPHRTRFPLSVHPFLTVSQQLALLEIPSFPLPLLVTYSSWSARFPSRFFVSLLLFWFALHVCLRYIHQHARNLIALTSMVTFHAPPGRRIASGRTAARSPRE